MRTSLPIFRLCIFAIGLLVATTTLGATGVEAMQDDTERARSALRTIEDAIQQRDVQLLARSFSSKVYITLFTGENGWYSAEQSYFILRNFFSTHTPLSLSLTPSGAASGTPYGVGTLLYMSRGRRSSAQIFVSLVRTDSGDFRLNQITVASR